VDRGGVGANPEIGLTLRSDENSYNDYYSWLDYSDDSAEVAQLEVEYTASGAGPSIPVLYHHYAHQ